MALRVKNWREFQHYSNRDPKWIKLHRSYLDDPDFMELPVASRALAPMLWLLAAKLSRDGLIPINDKRIAWMLRLPEDMVNEGLTPLLAAGFFTRTDVEQPASSPLAEPEQVASLEKRREEKRESANELPPLALAQKVAAELCVSGKGWIEAIAGAIEFCVKYESKTADQAVEFLIAQAKHSISQGKAPTTFWFSDRKWRKPGDEKPKKKSSGPNAMDQLWEMRAEMMGCSIEEAKKNWPGKVQ